MPLVITNSTFFLCFNISLLLLQKSTQSIHLKSFSLVIIAIITAFNSVGFTIFRSAPKSIEIHLLQNTLNRLIYRSMVVNKSFNNLFVFP